MPAETGEILCETWGNMWGIAAYVDFLSNLVTSS